MQFHLPKPLHGWRTFWDHFVVRLPDRPWPSSAWDAVKSNDVLRQVDPVFANQMYQYYAQPMGMLADNRSMVELAATLNSPSVMMPRGEGERLRYIDAAERIIDTSSKLALVASQLRDRLAKIGLPPPSAAERSVWLATKSGTIKFCRVHGLRLANLRPADAEQAF